MVLATPWIGVPALVLLFVLPRLRPQLPVAPLVLGLAIVAGWATGLTALPPAPGLMIHLPALTIPQDWRAIRDALELAVLPQLPLTLTNAVIITAAVCGDLYGARGARATVRNLALTSGTMNLLLAPFGAMPMCHGAGGVTAQHRFGARTGLAPVLFGVLLLVLALGFADSAAALFTAIPLSAVGALLLVAGTDLALSKRLFDAQPDCWPVVGIAAAGTALLNPAMGLVAGWAIELGRSALKRMNRPAQKS
jgi:MFS superfamily sulfate permease-like transporter